MDDVYSKILGPDGKPLFKQKTEDGDGFAVPSVMTFGNLVAGAMRSYWHLHSDEARRHSRENAIAMRRDPFLMRLLRERKNGVTSKKWHLEADNPRDPHQKLVCDAITKIIRNIGHYHRIPKYLLEAIWYGRYGVQLKWAWRPVPIPVIEYSGPIAPGVAPQIGKNYKTKEVLTVVGHRPVNGDKIDYHHDGTPYIEVNPMFKPETTADIEPIPAGDGGYGLFLRGSWRQRFLIHNYDPDDADYLDGEMAGAIYGVGVRSRIYWFDFMRRDYMAWYTEALQRMGLGMVVIEYDVSNPRSKEEASKAAKSYDRRNSVLLIPRSWDGRGSETVHIVETPTVGIEVLLRLQEKIEEIEELYVIGQTMSGGADNESGLGGSGRANFAKDTKSQIIADDALALAETLTGSEAEPGLINQIFQHTEAFRDYDFPPPRMVYDTEDVDVEGKLNAISAGVSLGMEFKEDSVREVIGEPAPEEGDNVIGGQQLMQGQPGQQGQQQATQSQQPPSGKDQQQVQLQPHPIDQALMDEGQAQQQGQQQYGKVVYEDLGTVEPPKSTADRLRERHSDWHPDHHDYIAGHIENMRHLASTPYTPTATQPLSQYLHALHRNPNVTNSQVHAIGHELGATMPENGGRTEAMTAVARHLGGMMRDAYRQGDETWQHVRDFGQGENSWRHLPSGQARTFHGYTRPVGQADEWVSTGLQGGYVNRLHGGVHFGDAPPTSKLANAVSVDPEIPPMADPNEVEPDQEPVAEQVHEIPPQMDWDAIEREDKAKGRSLYEEGADDPDDTQSRAQLIAEILTSVYGDDAIKFTHDLEDGQIDYEADGLVFYAWSSIDHPRGPNGRFIAKNSSEAAGAARSKIKSTLAGKKTAAGMKDLASHLSILTVKQLHDLRKEHGIDAKAKVKAELVAKIAEKLKFSGSDPENRLDKIAKADKGKLGKPEKQPDKPKPPEKKAKSEPAKEKPKEAKEAKKSDTKKLSTKKGSSHPLEGKSDAEMAAALSAASGGGKGNNPRGYDLKNYPSNINGGKLESDVKAVFDKLTSGNSFLTPTISDVYAGVSGNHPGMTMHDFQGALAKMSQDKKLRLSAYTLRPSTIPDKLSAMPLDGDLKYYVSEVSPGLGQESEKTALHTDRISGFESRSGRSWLETFLTLLPNVNPSESLKSANTQGRWNQLKEGKLWGKNMDRLLHSEAFARDFGSMDQTKLKAIVEKLPWELRDGKLPKVGEA